MKELLVGEKAHRDRQTDREKHTLCAFHLSDDEEDGLLDRREGRRVHALSELREEAASTIQITSLTMT